MPDSTKPPLPSTTTAATTTTSTNVTPTATEEPEDQPKKEALAAFTATLHSVGTNLEVPLRDRAATITANASALDKQENELAAHTGRLARQNAQWMGLADETREGLKEIGDVQNWAEVIERDLLVLEEMMGRVEEGERNDEEDEGGSGTGMDGVEGGQDGELNGKTQDDKKHAGGWLRWW